MIRCFPLCLVIMLAGAGETPSPQDRPAVVAPVFGRGEGSGHQDPERPRHVTLPKKEGMATIVAEFRRVGIDLSVGTVEWPEVKVPPRRSVLSKQCLDLKAEIAALVAAAEKTTDENEKKALMAKSRPLVHRVQSMSPEVVAEMEQATPVRVDAIHLQHNLAVIFIAEEDLQRCGDVIPIDEKRETRYRTFDFAAVASWLSQHIALQRRNGTNVLIFYDPFALIQDLDEEQRKKMNQEEQRLQPAQAAEQARQRAHQLLALQATDAIAWLRVQGVLPREEKTP